MSPNLAELGVYFNKHHIPELALNHIRTWLASEPIDASTSLFGVRVAYPSRIMGQTLHGGAHTIDLPFLILADHAWDTKLILDRPTHLTLRYSDGGGRKRAFAFTPDYCYVGEGRAELVECQREDFLRKAADPTNPRGQSWRYVAGGSQPWRCPPGEAAAATLGLGYRVFSTAEVSQTLVANLLFLRDYL